MTFITCITLALTATAALSPAQDIDRRQSEADVPEGLCWLLPKLCKRVVESEADSQVVVSVRVQSTERPGGEA